MSIVSTPLSGIHQSHLQSNILVLNGMTKDSLQGIFLPSFTIFYKVNSAEAPLCNLTHHLVPDNSRSDFFAQSWLMFVLQRPKIPIETMINAVGIKLTSFLPQLLPCEGNPGCNPSLQAFPPPTALVMPRSSHSHSLIFAHQGLKASVPKLKAMKTSS